MSTPAKVPSYVVKAEAFKRRCAIRETPYLAELAKLERMLDAKADKHAMVPGLGVALGDAAAVCRKEIDRELEKLGL